jgi:hypothetical protein
MSETFQEWAKHPDDEHVNTVASLYSVDGFNITRKHRQDIFS